jgi:hypothetical protein
MYYARSVYGHKILPKIAITSLQIVQFLVGFTFLYFYKDVPCFASNGMRMIFFFFTYAYVGTVLCLFMNFFLVNYVCKSKKARKPKSP